MRRVGVVAVADGCDWMYYSLVLPNAGLYIFFMGRSAEHDHWTLTVALILSCRRDALTHCLSRDNTRMSGG
jgi:hypothetical protein